MKDILYIIVKLINKEKDAEISEIAHDYVKLSIKNCSIYCDPTWVLPRNVIKHITPAEFILILKENWKLSKGDEFGLIWSTYCCKWNREIKVMWPDCEELLF